MGAGSRKGLQQLLLLRRQQLHFLQQQGTLRCSGCFPTHSSPRKGRPGVAFTTGCYDAAAAAADARIASAGNGSDNVSVTRVSTGQLSHSLSVTAFGSDGHAEGHQFLMAFSEGPTTTLLSQPTADQVCAGVTQSTVDRHRVGHEAAPSQLIRSAAYLNASAVSSVSAVSVVSPLSSVGKRPLGGDRLDVLQSLHHHLHAPAAAPFSSSAAAAKHTVACQAAAAGAASTLAAEATAAATVDPPSMSLSVPNPDSLFRSEARPLGDGPNPKVVAAPKGAFTGALLRALGYYGRESRLIRGANCLYDAVRSRADDLQFQKALGLDGSFRPTHALLVLHVWLCLRRLRQEGADGAEVGQTLYELFNHDCEKRVVAAGVTVLISKWMRELEKNFYGAALAYDAAVAPGAAKDALVTALWRNVFSDGVSEMPTGAAAAPIRALARYVRREVASLSLTDSDAVLTGNIRFTNNSTEK